MYNIGREIFIEIGEFIISYEGPKSLKEFKEILLYENGYIEVNAVFEISGLQKIEEDYIDLEYLLSKKGYNSNEILSRIENIEIKK